MITFFTVPKPFKGDIAIIQENAIKSWLRLHSKCEVILYGDEEGVKEICEKYSLSHVPSIEKNEYGTPTLKFIFNNVQKISKNKILCYVNSDIILFSDVITTIKRIPFQKFLLVGQRRDADISNIINYEDLAWESELRDYIMENQKPFHGGIDYFIFPKHTFSEIPPFAVGRAGWDNWMIYNSRKLNIPTIDATQSIMAVHQNHSYSHVPNRTGINYYGPESDNNVILSGGRRIYLWDLDDVNWTVTPSYLIHKNITLRECFRFLILKSPRFFHPLFEAGFWIQHIIRYKKIG
jgi:hypothetical protein